jgi:hypothetical protein
MQKRVKTGNFSCAIFSKNRRGLSTVVTTLILIVISLVAVGAVWIVVSNLLKGQSNQVALDRITFDAEITGLALNNATNSASITVQRNVGAGDIKGMKFYFYNSTDAEIKTEYFTLTELASKKFLFNLDMSFLDLSKVSIVPIFNSKDGKDNLGNVADTYDVKKGARFESQNQTCSPTVYTYSCSGKVNFRLDDCGNWQNITCTTNQICVANATRCVANTTCIPSNYTYSCLGNKSIRLDNCGSTQNITCTSTQICIANATRCRTNTTTCIPTTCSAQGYVCGTWANGTCAGTLNCGTCSGGQTCNATGRCVTYTPTNNKQVGMNLAEINYWETQIMFVNVMKYSSEWFTPNQNYEWDTGQRNLVPADSDGYPLQIPYTVGSNQLYFSTLILRNGGYYPSGNYVVLYDGTGTLEFGWDASVVSSSAGRIVISVTPNEGILMTIRSSSSSDHIRNIRVIMPGFENTYATQIFYPPFLAGLQNFSAIRYMNTMKMNPSGGINYLTSWSNRTTLTTYTQTKDTGFAPEYVYLLSNRLNEDAWINIPARADDNYIRQLARMMNNNLNSNLKVYVEYANEIWNGGYDAFDWCGAMGKAMGIVPYDGTSDLGSEYNFDFAHVMLYQAKRSVDVFRIFEEEFSDDSRLVKVLASQGANYGVATGVIGYFEDSRVNPTNIQADALAIAPYLGNYVNSGTVSQALDSAFDWFNNNPWDPGQGVIQWMIANRQIAEEHDMTLLAYEGGQGLIPGSSSMSNIVQQANDDPRMGQLYTQYLNAWVQYAGDGVNMLYNYVTDCSEYGCWGALKYQNQPYSQSVKYTAIKNYLDSN